MYRVERVVSKSDEEVFLTFPKRLYKEEGSWACPLDSEVNKQFYSESNPLLKSGEVCRWFLIEDKSGDVVGRIAAFYDSYTSGTFIRPTGGVGFFDVIEEYSAAELLFDTAKEWLINSGMEAMNGPINFGSRDEFWGCLVDGFHEPLFNMPYNFSYYKEFFERYGFQNYFNQYTYRLDFNSFKIHPVVRRGAERIVNNPDYHFEIAERGNYKYAADFRTIYNKAWANFSGIKEMTEEEANMMLKAMMPILDPRLVHFCYFNKEPVGFFINMPDIGQVTKRFNGKMNLMNKLRLYYHVRIAKSIDRIIGRIFGVVPEFQNRGIEAALALNFEKITKDKSFQYRTLELNWIGDFNPVMMKVCSYIGSEIYKTHTTYQYIFDRDVEFKRATVVNV